MKDFLQSRLRRVIRRHQWLRLSHQLTVCWVLAALAGLGLMLLRQRAGWSSPIAFPLLGALAGGASLALFLRNRQTSPDERAIAQKIEDTYPDLRGLVLTAVQQFDTPEKQQGYLQHRVTQQALDHCQRTQGWRRAVPESQVRWGTAAQFAALALFLVALWNGGVSSAVRHGTLPVLARGINVTPGDTTIERGESLVVLARFGGALPVGVDLVVNDAVSPARKIPLVKSLGDPMFGGSVPEVSSDFTYHLDYGGEHTRDFTVKVYEYPRLARADVDLKFPDYTHLGTKRIEDTHRVSAVEGTQLGLTLQLNKPVATAALVARNQEKTEIPLAVVAGKAVASLANFPLAASQSYDLKLVDAEGRANKVTTPFVIEVLPNRRPELKLASPRGDVRPSALEEVTFEGTVWDDFGAPAYGIAYTVAGQDTKFIELGQGVPGKEKRSFSHIVRLEDLGAKPDDLVSWYVWADDIGPDGQVRRTSTDMYFAEVRPFEEIFRESQGMQSQQDEQQQQGQGSQTPKLSQLEKQIISGTWKLQRDPTSPKYSEDAAVIHDAQEQTLAQAQEAQGNATNPRTQALWNSVTKEMEEATKQLAAAEKSPKSLGDALKAEQAANQALLKLRARETDVARGRNRGQNGGQQGNQRQIDELDLTQSENRYETQRQARTPQTPQRQEQNQVLNRLQELARRQQDVNDRLKELQTALQAARTEQEKEDVRRQLKRLQEEQQQMLSDIDETRQRMDRPENQSAMQQQRQQLDQTRDDVQRAADATGQGSVAQALASGTRAQRQLQQMRDELRKQNSSEFSDDLRQMRSDARDLAQQQEDTAKKIAALDNPQHKTLSDAPERQTALNQLEQEQKRMNDLLQRATQVSEQAENSEPLLSRQLYDSVRKVTQDDVKTMKDFRKDLLEQGLLTRSLNDRLEQSANKEGGAKSLELTTEMLREGYLPQAGQASQHATAGINDLKRGVERAAESVLDDDAEALKLAQSELDNVTQQLERELAQAQSQAQAQAEAGAATTPGQQPGQSQTPGQAPAPGSSGGRTPAPGRDPASDQRQAANDSTASTPGENSTPDASGQGQTPGQGGRKPGQAPGQQSRGTGTGGESPGDNPQLADSQPGAQRQRDRGAGTARGERNGQQAANNNRPGGDQNAGQRGGLQLDTLMNGNNQEVAAGGADRGGGGGYIGGPLTGDNFGPWSDRLRNVEELLDQPALRDAVANARERARLLRQDYKRDLKKPDWTVVQLQVLKPLFEVRSRVSEELARRDSKDPLVPIDRDPVPDRYAESVRRYYEELGKDK